MNTEEIKKLVEELVTQRRAVVDIIDSWATEMANISGKVGHVFEEMQKTHATLKQLLDEQSSA